MLATERNFIRPILLVVLAASAAIATVEERVPRRDYGRNAQMTQGATTPLNQTSTSIPVRNLALQPEALKVSRKLGRRFRSTTPRNSTLTGELKTDSGVQAVLLVRRQTARGEQIRIVIGTDPEAFTWDEAEGTKSTSGTLDEARRSLIERLAFDSVDQFVLAQLRGAGYSTVGQNVRPTNADDNYNGPLWDIIRVDDPERNPDKKPSSHWRLYYINTKTGLIDKVVSEIRSHRVEADFSSWSEQSGEKFPARIVWKSNGQVLMDMRISGFTVSAAEGAN